MVKMPVLQGMRCSARQLRVNAHSVRRACLATRHRRDARDGAAAPVREVSRRDGQLQKHRMHARVRAETRFELHRRVRDLGGWAATLATTLGAPPPARTSPSPRTSQSPPSGCPAQGWRGLGETARTHAPARCLMDRCPGCLSRCRLAHRTREPVRDTHTKSRRRRQAHRVM
jgi:hypothetical protein